MSDKRRTITLSILVAVVVVGWAFVSFSPDLRTASLTSGTAPLAEGEIISGYKQWTRVNPVPVIMQSAVAALCGRPTTQQSTLKQENPHRDKFITVYVNDIGRQAMMEQKIPRFPKNSVIVKEKLTNKDSSAPELLTVMIKREGGYDAENGDWEYMVLDGSGKSVQASGRLPVCQGCHTMVKSTDYVSRNYLPATVRQKLK